MFYRRYEGIWGGWKWRCCCTARSAGRVDYPGFPIWKQRNGKFRNGLAADHEWNGQEDKAYRIYAKDNHHRCVACRERCEQPSRNGTSLFLLSGGDAFTRIDEKSRRSPSDRYLGGEVRRDDRIWSHAELSGEQPLYRGNTSAKRCK